MSLVEVLGFVTGAVCVWLAVRQNIWTYPIGIANNVVFFVLFWGSGLYGDAWLQVFYVGVALHGWWSWLRGGPQRTVLRVRHTPRWGWLLGAAGVAIGTWAAYLLLTRHTDSTVPLPDGLTTALSVVAQLMMNRKWLGSWLVWMVADVLYIWLYLVKGLALTAALYAGFLALCVVGWRQWRTALVEQPAQPRVPAEAGR
ncbi:MAG TPA: nicotinamide riboside transporter PnuC [Dermatophilaceae bacterium]|nr:nicotinamide riboside transporter PnuC [Dermatophilaceae bacterium]